MKAYETKDIRNLCVLGHGGAGKTSLTETMLFLGKGCDRIGKIADSNTVSDFDAEEVKRKISVYTTVEPVEWKDKKINILDTPGFFDFESQVKEAVRVSDSALIVLSAKSGVKVGTERAWAYAEERKIPKIIFINKMDDDKADFKKTIEDLKAHFGASIAPFYVPMTKDDKFIGYVNVIKMEARKFEDGKIVDMPVPDDMLEVALPARQMILESIAETSEELMEKYFAGEEFTEEEITAALKQGVENLEITPVLCGSAYTTLSIRKLLDAINDYLPNPYETASEYAHYLDNNDEVEIHYREERPFSSLVFKTISDPFVGRLSFIKIYSGSLSADTPVFNSRAGETEKIGKIYFMCGKKQNETQKVCAGDICAIPKLSITKTGDTLCAPERKIVIDPPKYPLPQTSKAIYPKNKGDEEKISQGIAKIKEEDKTILFESNNETHQTVISGMGETHLDVVVNKLKEKYKVDVELKDVKIAYRETIRAKATAEGKHKKQSGGHGQFGHVIIEFEFCPDKEGLTFEEKVVGGSVPKNYFPAVEKGLLECCERGVVAGYPVVNLKATLLDGSYHPVDSSEMAFKTAASIAFKEGLTKAKPVLLEPVNTVEVVVPDNYMGDIIGDINKRRGKVLGMIPEGNGMQKVVAEVPSSEMLSYSTDLRSMTGGRGSYTQEFARYEDAPPAIVEKAVADFKKEE